MLTLVRVVAPHFVAGFESNGTVCRAAPILKYLVGKTNDEARAYIAREGWRASIVPTIHPASDRSGGSLD
ncbi:hypothetical protein ACRQ5Q_14955 [Bradyrhizobium sp. PMVTL-01]|uniref:hypothetical protein n=1 Tax=Bradyrhizobium sp. PMVTL-01 TaxID=3434999 RepID=UPI003F711015